MKVVAFGEILWDIIDEQQHLGGAPLNFAAHSAQCGNEAFIISRLGTDHLGLRAFEQCKGFGVSQRLIQWDEKNRTGTVDVKLIHGQPDYVIHENVAYDFIDIEQVDKTALKDVDVLYFGTLAQRNAVSARTLGTLLSSTKSRYVFYDVNLRKGCYNATLIRSSLQLSNVFKLNTEELPLIGRMLFDRDFSLEEFLKNIRQEFTNIEMIIVTAADKGCYVFNAEQLTHIPGVAVVLADAVGAGDAFSAAFMHMLVKSGDAMEAARVANRVGAFVASRHGAIPTYSEEIRELL